MKYNYVDHTDCIQNQASENKMATYEKTDMCNLDTVCLIYIKHNITVSAGAMLLFSKELGRKIQLGLNGLLSKYKFQHLRLVEV